MKPSYTDIRRQEVNCPHCGEPTHMKQIVEWGLCEECRARDEKEAAKETEEE
jgi:ribosomal protein L37AE/L43A